ncbi:PPR repeat [Musa troglodytarum]|uniref:PPR repeat n=1 Tax=Musa troglodytarum TaxID=320322 RepID=A0A9E7HE74_9LILI|nr:PPR repeat [Musa troglodytarum]URE31556.1 PPR repeat [Musa troglodytarum]
MFSSEEANMQKRSLVYMKKIVDLGNYGKWMKVFCKNENIVRELISDENCQSLLSSRLTAEENVIVLQSM